MEAEKEWNSKRRESNDGGLNTRKALPILRALYHKAYCADTIAKGGSSTTKNNNKRQLVQHLTLGLFRDYSETIPDYSGTYRKRLKATARTLTSSLLLVVVVVCLFVLLYL